MAGDQFSLCWDNFHSNMSSGLSSLLKSEALVDVTLAAEGKYMKAHKMVLSVCSPYFRELFEVNPCQHPIVFLKDVSYNSLSYLMEFMYQGEVRVSQDDLGTFIKTAEALKIKGLTGEGSNQTETEPEPIKPQSETPQNSSTPTPATRRTAHERSPAPTKKLLGPASKRFRSDVEQQHHMQPEQPEPTPDKHTNSENPIMQFKVEPDDGVITLENDEDGTYDDTGMDDMGMDNSADYLLEPASDAELKDVKASTSSTTNATDSTGENQGAILEETEKIFLRDFYDDSNDEDNQQRCLYRRRKPKEKFTWKKICDFETSAEAEEFIEKQQVWRRCSSNRLANGIKVVYRCGLGQYRKKECPARMYLFYHASSLKISAYSTESEHDNHGDASNYGLDDDIKDLVSLLYRTGIENPDYLLAAIQRENLHAPPKTKLMAYLRQLKNKSS